MAEPGTLRISHYRVEQELSRDALGYFFRAVDEQLDRPVVLRVARASQQFEGQELATLRARIREQARAAAQLSHPNLVTIHEFRALSETDLVVMELVEGETLEASRKAGHRWTVLDAARLLARVADALAGAHAVGLVHGNVNAANIRVRPDGRVKLLDLGIPKLELFNLAPADPADDVRALARVACEMLAPPVTEELPPGTTRRDPLSDPVLGRAQFGFLAPVLARAIRDPRGYESAAAFRDALLLAMDMATGRAPAGGDIDAGFGTHPVGPAKAATEDVLPPDGRTLAPLGRVGPSGGPRLVLPPDLKERAPDIDRVELFQVRPIPHQRHGFFDRFLERVGTPVLIGAGLLLAAILVTIVLLQRGPATGQTADPEANAPPLAGGPIDPDAGTAVDSIAAAAADSATAITGDSLTEGPAPATPAVTPTAMRERPLFTAWVRARPPGTRIRVLGQEGTWQDTVELSVPAGDSLTVEFSRLGYVPQQRVFTGSRLSVVLQPDSVVAEFDANVAATVYVLAGETPRRLGETPLVTRLPTGTHRFLYRAPGQVDWQTEMRMPRPGETYRVRKMDYITTGTLIATVSSSWGMVSVDGGTPVETPARFDGLAAGPHVVRIMREGFQTITDTVVVMANQTVRRAYTLRR